MPQELIDDCFRSGQEQLSHDQAVALLQARIVPVVGVETVPLTEAAGRVIAAPAIARFPVPAHTNSAVDGYAFARAAHTGGSGQRWPVAGRVAAGHPRPGMLGAGETARIFTGAVMPLGSDTVVMQEDVIEAPGETGEVLFQQGLKAGANVRAAGEDVKAGEALLAVGETIRPQDIAGLASIGFGEVPVFERLKVGIVSTGDEIVEPGSRELRPGEVFDANRGMLKTLAEAAGAQVTDLGIWADEAALVRARLADAARRLDVIITSGGASRGDEDHMAAAIDGLGQRHFWQILVKPGRPMMMGQVERAAVVGLPGNPVSVFVCFLMYVWPMLKRMGGSHWPTPLRLTLPAAFAYPNRKLGRRERWRGRMVERDGQLHVEKFQRDGSGVISSLRWADCLIDIPEDLRGVQPGDPVSVIPFTQFGIPRL